MSGVSNIIEAFIKNLLENADGTIEIQRNELAEYFQCAPSQINYVLSTRFTQNKGYYIESRRGGGGYIKIIKVSINEYEDINDIIVNTIGDSITKNKAFDLIEGLLEEDIISQRESDIIKAAIGDSSLKCDLALRNSLRAYILKNIMLILVK
ncbi:CtsR family transcriptional regulator [Tissierella creatinini]|nr:CtsR family transcriptional regulator [Tissierella creatinini]TJX65105.1 CtsR family transcriptional regulator [Soehngenia saccharolytica]